MIVSSLRIGCTLLVGCTLFVGSAVLTAGSAVGQIPEPSATDALDSRLLAELNRRQLYDLAADFARVRVRSRPDPEARAYWTDQLVRTYLRQMWRESRLNRESLMQQSAELITEFPEHELLLPETELAMRLTQIETLLNLAKINLLLNTVGHRGPQRPSTVVASAGVMRLVDQAEELVVALLKQLQQNRGRLARRRAGLLRERGNLLAVELSVIRWLAIDSEDASSGPAADTYREIRNRVQAFSRAARGTESRRRAAQMLADLQLAAGDSDAVRLLLRDRSEALSAHRRQLLKLRLLLREDKAMEALEESYSGAGPGTAGELSVLRLEAVLLLRMQADSLQDTALRTRSDSAMTEQMKSVMGWPSSVWKDAALKVLQRYELVRTVGAEVAVLVDQVELLRRAGRADDAIRVLKRALKLLPADGTAQPQAAIRLSLGEIFISQQKWDDARPLLQQATALFLEAEQRSAAATAALLDVYCLGQQWRRTPADDGLRDAYFQGLLEHRQRWRGETATNESTSWLVQLTQQLDPLLAADVLAERASETETRPEQIDALIRLGEQLERARGADGPTRSGRTWSQLVQELTTTCSNQKLIEDELTDASAQLLLLSASLTTDAATELSEWGRLHQRMAAVEMALVNADLAVRRRLSLLQLLAQVRSSTDTQRATQRRKQYALDVRDDPAEGAGQLARYLSPSGRMQPGDRAVAETLEPLLAVQIPTASTAADLSGLLSMATLASRVTRDETIRQQLVSRLLTLDLTTEQTTQIAEAMMTSESQLSGPTGGSLRKLWQRIHDETKEGSDLWLESCLQLALIQAASGEVDDLAAAARRLEVTSVIHPDWGSVHRKRRVQELLRRTQAAAGSP